MQWLVGMETSGAIRERLRDIGVEAWSCDLLPSQDGSRYHIEGDVFDFLDKGWDGAVFHPTCTYLTISAAWAFNDPDFEKYPGVGYHQRVKEGTLTGAARREARDAAVEDVARLWNSKIPVVIIENPIGALSKRFRKPTQIVQPYMFGDDASKATCLWIRGAEGLKIPAKDRWHPGREVEWPRGSGKIVTRWSNQTDSGQSNVTPSEDRWQKRSDTFPGIADAIVRDIAVPMMIEAAA